MATTVLTLYQIDAFTGVPFGGNSAAVALVPPGLKLSDELRQQIAMEMNLSETAFIEPVGGSDFRTVDRYILRWFTPQVEVKLCGHATVAAAAALLQGEGNSADLLLFDTLHSGQLSVRHLQDEGIEYAPPPQSVLQLTMPLHAPTDPVPEVAGPGSELVKLTVGEAAVSEVGFNAGLGYLMIVLTSSGNSELETLAPDIPALKKLLPASSPVFGIIVTCGADDGKHEFLSRFWAPHALGGEDPVTGSAHAVTGPYWSRKLKQKVLAARQCSKRGGELVVLTDEEAGFVRVSGMAAIVFKGELRLP